jgi:hypothetical protein
MAVTIVRGVVQRPAETQNSATPAAVSPAPVASSDLGRRAGDVARSGVLDSAVRSNRRNVEPGTPAVRDATTARYLAEDVSDEIRGQGGDDAHEGLDPVSAREHFRRH